MHHLWSAPLSVKYLLNLSLPCPVSESPEAACPRRSPDHPQDSAPSCWGSSPGIMCIHNLVTTILSLYLELWGEQSLLLLLEPLGGGGQQLLGLVQLHLQLLGLLHQLSHLANTRPSSSRIFHLSLSFLSAYYLYSNISAFISILSLSLYLY